MNYERLDKHFKYQDGIWVRKSGWTMPKGPSFERDFCKKLSLWWTDGKHEDIFWRTHGSGGRATVRAMKGKRTYGQSGDICAVHPQGRRFMKLVTIELKRGYNKHNFFDVLDKSKNAALQVWEKWWQKTLACRDNEGSLFWMIVVKRDYRDPFVFVPTVLFDLLFQPQGDILLDEEGPIPVMHAIVRLKKVNGKLSRQHISGFPLSFFWNLKPETVRELVQRLNKGKK